MDGKEAMKILGLPENFLDDEAITPSEILRSYLENKLENRLVPVVLKRILGLLEYLAENNEWETMLSFLKYLWSVSPYNEGVVYLKQEAENIFERYVQQTTPEILSKLLESLPKMHPLRETVESAVVDSCDSKNLYELTSLLDCNLPIGQISSGNAWGNLYSLLEERVKECDDAFLLVRLHDRLPPSCLELKLVIEERFEEFLKDGIPFSGDKERFLNALPSYLRVVEEKRKREREAENRKREALSFIEHLY